MISPFLKLHLSHWQYYYHHNRFAVLPQAQISNLGFQLQWAQGTMRIIKLIQTSGSSFLLMMGFNHTKVDQSTCFAILRTMANHQLALVNQSTGRRMAMPSYPS